MKLEWKPIKGYENLYMVSNYGQVKSLEQTIVNSNGVKKVLKEKILKPILKDGEGGYLRVVLYKDGKIKRFYLHRLVAEHFLDNKEGKREVNHIDGNKKNCRVDNLEWMNRSENVKHMWDKGLRV